MEIQIEQEILAKNKKIALENARLFEEKGVFVINLMASPGAGKTTFVLATLEGIGEDYRVAVVEGDVASKVDAERIKKTGTPVVQINTGGACHLESRMIQKALAHFDLSELDVIIIENVGNLVCPAEFPLGERYRVAILSVPEGDDKPEKYPLMFHQSDVLIVSKVDLLELSNFDLEKVKRTVTALNSKIKIFTVSCQTGQGVDDWLTWLKDEIVRFKEAS
jgi:hydrogenase nickel incorporation protein HypB